MKYFTTTFILCLLSSCSFADNEEQPLPSRQGDVITKVNNNEEKPPRPVQPKEQEGVSKYISSLKSSNVTAFCLFSSAGWVRYGIGQYCRISDGKKYFLYSRPPQANTYAAKDIKIKRWLELEKINEASKDLSDLNAKALDNTRFQYVVFHKDKDKVSVLKSIVIDDPDVAKNSPKHDALLKELTKDLDIK